MKKQRLLSLLLAITTVLAMIPSMLVVATADDFQANTEVTANENEIKQIDLGGKTYHIISTAAQMNSLAADGAKNFILADDLEYSAETPFTQIVLGDGCTFDGNGYSVYGFSLTGAQSVFKAKTNDGSETIAVQNVNIGLADEGKHINHTVTAPAGIVFSTTKATLTISGVNVYATMTHDAVNTLYVGGFIGTSAGNLIIKDSAFYGSIQSTASAHSRYSREIGGFVGRFLDANATVTVTNCANYGTITAATACYMGGFFGAVRDVTTFSLSDSVNYGELSITSNGTTAIGGCVGLNIGSGSKNISGCLNVGDLYGRDLQDLRVGGIVGQIDAGMNITNCANIGYVEGGFVGGIIGLVNYTPIDLKDCGFFGSIKASLKKTDRLAGAIIGGTSKTDLNAELVEGLVSTYDDCLGLAWASGAHHLVEMAYLEGESATAEALAWLRVNITGAGCIFGEQDGKIISDATPTQTKYMQYKYAEDGSLDLRILGFVNVVEEDLQKYSKVGFDVKITKKDSEKVLTQYLTTTTVYTSINATEASGIRTYTATELGASYLYAIELHNIPKDGIFTIEIIATSLENVTNAETVKDGKVTFTVENGIIQ